MSQMPAVARPPSASLKTYEAVAAEFDKPERMAALAALLGSDEVARRFIQVALHAISTDSQLLREGSPLSIFQAVKDAAMLGLEPTGLLGEGVITVYKGTAKFQPMWRGYLKLVRRSREVTGVDCQIVYDNDAFRLVEGTEPRIEHEPILPPKASDFPEDQAFTVAQWRGGYRGVYAWARYKDDPDHPVIEWMTVAQINEVRDQFSASVKAKRSSPWDTSWGEMARKTVIKRLAKRLPQSTLDLALMMDNDAEPLEELEEGPTAPRLAAVAAAQAAIEARTGTPIPPEEPEALSGTEDASADEQAIAAQPVAFDPELDFPPAPADPLARYRGKP